MSYSRPLDTQRTLDGFHYKIGVHGKPYWWNGQDWIKSSRPITHITTGNTNKIPPTRGPNKPDRSIQ